MKNSIKELREKHKITQDELALRLGVSRQTVISLEKGHYDPSIKLAFKIAQEFHLKIEDVFTYEEEEE